MTNKIDVQALRKQHAAGKTRSRDRLQKAHERGIQAIRAGDMGYRQAVEMVLRGAPPVPAGPPVLSANGGYQPHPIRPTT